MTDETRKELSKEWEEETDRWYESLPNLHPHRPICQWRKISSHELKTFIRNLFSQAIQQERGQWVKEIEGMKKKIVYPRGFNIIDTDADSRIVPNKNYNQALTDVLAIINNKHE